MAKILMRRLDSKIAVVIERQLRQTNRKPLDLEQVIGVFTYIRIIVILRRIWEYINLPSAENISD